MEDERIVEMYFERNESAIAETQKKYGRYCHAIARRILCSDQDSEECVNDTYLRAWEAIPPHKPTKLSVFLGKIVRNLALNRYAHNHAQKRFDGVEVALDELAEVLADPESEADDIQITSLREVLNGFLATLPADARIIFLRRYWYFCPIKDIAEGMGIGESRVKVTLHRTRAKLKEYLIKEGISI
jgi:RNA polymerase sigma-70 factor (ECF subfamily)